MDLSNYTQKIDEIYFKEKLIDLKSLEKKVSVKKHSKQLNSDLFYASKSAVKILDDNDGVFVKVEENNYQNVYISYLTLDNSFNCPPVESLVDITVMKKYRFYIDLEKHSNIEVKPIIVHYSLGKKEKLTELVKTDEMVNFLNNEDQCRLTFKVVGHGEFTIKNISVVPEDGK